MSFILDALKKSENERQQQADTEFSSVPSSPDGPAMPRWLWLLGGLLLINVVVIAGLLLRADSPPQIAGAIEVPAIEQPGTAESASGAATTSFADQLTEVRRNRPEPQSAHESRSVAGEPGVAGSEMESAPASSTPAPSSAARNSAAVLPSLTELRANGSLQLPDLHIDIHVYSNVPNERFVFINMKRYREHATLAEGPMVDEITNEGVVLSYQGSTFLLSRDD